MLSPNVRNARARAISNTDLPDLVAEWTSTVDEHCRERFTISLVEAADNLYHGSPQPIPPIWRGGKFSRLKRR